MVATIPATFKSFLIEMSCSNLFAVSFESPFKTLSIALKN